MEKNQIQKTGLISSNSIENRDEECGCHTSRAKEGIKMTEYQKGEREEYKLYDRGVQEREEKMGWGEKKF